MCGSHLWLILYFYCSMVVQNIPQSYPTQGVGKLGFYSPTSTYHWLKVTPRGVNSPVFQPAHVPASFCSQRNPSGRAAETCHRKPSVHSRTLSGRYGDRAQEAPAALPYTNLMTTFVSYTNAPTSHLQTKLSNFSLHVFLIHHVPCPFNLSCLL